ncbi:hypothetical protein Acr_00g0033630 [Actinidia rufa]|uniref:Uncharacterized protein n=1 Tax=Actinidia rufa TaxID=165716 RepID=A0A7J0DHM9_9ERIC|nr:hypothetical protein Acr_00g0033630 [Actinidia rufa]
MLATSPQNNLALMNFWSPSILLFEPPRLQSTLLDQRTRILCIAVPLHPNLSPEISPYNKTIAIPMIADCSPHGTLLRSLQNHRDTLPKLSFARKSLLNILTLTRSPISGYIKTTPPLYKGPVFDSHPCPQAQGAVASGGRQVHELTRRYRVRFLVAASHIRVYILRCEGLAAQGTEISLAPQLSPSADLSLLSVHSPSPFAYSNKLCAPGNPPRITSCSASSSLSGNWPTLSIYRPQSKEDELMAELIHASILDNGEPPSATSSQPSATSLPVSSFLPFHSHPEKEEGSINEVVVIVVHVEVIWVVAWQCGGVVEVEGCCGGRGVVERWWTYWWCGGESKGVIVVFVVWWKDGGSGWVLKMVSWCGKWFGWWCSTSSDGKC